MKRWLIAVILFCSTSMGYALQETTLLIQNSEARDPVSLNGPWNVIVDPYENGFYNHRFEEHENGYFKNKKPQAPSDPVEYDFAKSPKLQVPGDWNTQDEKLVVKVDNSRERDQIPTVNTDWWNYGGITRPVKIGNPGVLDHPV